MFNNFFKKLFYFTIICIGFNNIYHIFNMNYAINPQDNFIIGVISAIISCVFIGVSFKKFIECFYIKNLDEKFKGINLSLTHNLKGKLIFFFLSFLVSGGFISMILILLFYRSFKNEPKGK